MQIATVGAHTEKKSRLLNNALIPGAPLDDSLRSFVDCNQFSTIGINSEEQKAPKSTEVDIFFLFSILLLLLLLLFFLFC